ncbi:MAG: LEA type 2 family protein [Gemmatimonadaceae bacterium]
MNKVKWSLGMLLVLVVGACASLGRASFQEPLVTFKDARITGLGVSGGSLEIILDVYNPNRFRLEGTRVTYKVMVDSTEFGEGAYTSKFAVDEKATTEVRLPLTFTYRGVGAAGRALQQTGTVEYHVIGEISVASPIGDYTRPYDQRGRFSTLQGNSR